jgi:hypothetical protein
MPDLRKTTVRVQLIGVVTMSVGLGAALLTALENVLRGQSFVWWLVLAVLITGAISTGFSCVMNRLG